MNSLHDHDRLDQLNAFLNPHIQRLLGSEDSKMVRTGISEIIPRLRESKEYQEAIGAAVPANEPLLVSDKVGNELVAFDIVDSISDGRLLSEMRPISYVHHEKDTKCKGDIRLVVFPRGVRTQALLTLDVLFDEINRIGAQLQFTWRHNLDSNKSASLVCRISGKLAQTLNSQSISTGAVPLLRLFGDLEDASFSLDQLIDEKNTAAWQQVSSADYIELHNKQFVLFSDVEPIFDAPSGVGERQLGIIISADSLINTLVVEALCNFIAESSVYKLKVSTYLLILNDLISRGKDAVSSRVGRTVKMESNHGNK